MNKNFSYLLRNRKFPIRNKNFMTLKIKIIIISVIVMIGIIVSFPHFFRFTYIVTIANKTIIRCNNIDTYFVYTQMQDGNIRTFKNTNSLLEFKFNSNDIYGLEFPHN